MANFIWSDIIIKYSTVECLHLFMYMVIRKISFKRLSKEVHINT